MQAEPAKKNLPTHNFEGRKEELIQMKIKRKHRRDSPVFYRQKPNMQDDFLPWTKDTFSQVPDFLLFYTFLNELGKEI